MEHMQKLIDAYIQMEKEAIDNLNTEDLNATLQALINAFNNEKRVFVCGNGGSASTATHLTSDFNKGFDSYKGKRFNMISLVDNIAVLSAIGNDISYNDIFSYQLKDRIEPDEILLCISGSGNSENIIRAAEYAKSQGAVIIGFTGFDGGKLGKLSDIHVNVPINNMQIAEDVHLIFNHLLVWVLHKLREEE